MTKKRIRFMLLTSEGVQDPNRFLALPTAALTCFGAVPPI
jgi:hypothetical protein